MNQKSLLSDAKMPQLSNFMLWPVVLTWLAMGDASTASFSRGLRIVGFSVKSLRLTCFVYVKFINCSPSNRLNDFGFLRVVQAIFVWSLMRRVVFWNMILRLTKDEIWFCYCEDRSRITGLRYEQGYLTWFHFCSMAFITSLMLRPVITSA